MAIPDFQSVMRPLLVILQDGSALPLSELRERIAVVFSLTEAERKERVPSGQTFINNRIGWARTYLHKAGLLTIPSKGMTQITPRGLDALASGPERITVAWLKQFPEFVEFHTAKSQSVEAPAQPVRDSTDATPDEQLADAHQALVRTLADDLLVQVKAGTPSFF